MAKTKKTDDQKTTRRKQLTRTEYDKLKQTAYEYVVVKGLDQKEVAKLINVSEATMSKWANEGSEGSWTELREARQQCSSTDADNTKKLLQLMSKQRLELETLIHEAVKSGNIEDEVRYRKQASSLSDEMSKVNKTLLSLDNNNYTLGTYIDILDNVFSALRQYNEELWFKTLDFQSLHVRKITNELG